MIIQIACEELKSFLKKCYCGGLVKDLVIHASLEKGLYARFSTVQKSFYGEVYHQNVKIDEEGSIKVPHVKKLMDVISRIDSKIVLIKSNDSVFTVTDGISIGKMKADMLQIGEAETVESYVSIQNKGQIFDAANINYSIVGIQYEDGCQIGSGMLGEILKDAKAFGYEVYNFQSSATKKGQKLLKCLIINEYTTERVQRVIAEDTFIGNIENVNDIMVGKGFREILDGVLGDSEEISLYFHPLSLLITDRKTFYFNLHTLVNQ